MISFLSLRFEAIVLELSKKAIGEMENILRPSRVANYLADLFALALYRKVQPLILSSHPSLHIYTDNATFWTDALAKRHYQMMRIQCKRFHLMEWIPSAPGRYFTDPASLSRKSAAPHIDTLLNEYRPQGKSQMIQGGMGSFRLAVQRFDGTNRYFLGATSTGVSHEGIPVLLNERDYQHVIPLISRSGGCVVDMEGTLQILQRSGSEANTPFSLLYDPGIPRYAIVVDHLHLRGPSPEENLVATVAIAFSLKNPPFPLAKGWAYTSFHPGWRNELDKAVRWLQGYAERYSGMSHQLRILADFDEHYQHFASPVEFPLQQMTTQTFNTALATRYQRQYARRTTRGNLPMQKEAASLEESTRKPVRTLLCFSRQDELFAEAFKASLKALQRKKYIDIHTEDDIPAGAERQEEMERRFEQAQLILLLLSPDFLADTYCYEELAQRALQLHEQEKATVIIIYLRPVHYGGLPLQNIQLLPENAFPVSDAYWESVDHAFYEIVKQLEEMIEPMNR